MYFEKWTHALCFNMPTFKLVMVRSWTLFYYRVETREDNIHHHARQHSITPSYVCSSVKLWLVTKYCVQQLIMKDHGIWQQWQMLRWTNPWMPSSIPLMGTFFPSLHWQRFLWPLVIHNQIFDTRKSLPLLSHPASWIYQLPVTKLLTRRSGTINYGLKLMRLNVKETVWPYATFLRSTNTSYMLLFVHSLQPKMYL